MKDRIAILLFAPLIMVALAACQTDSRQQVLATTKSQVELRSFQTRAFDTTDREKTLRTIIATLQDLGFTIDQADAELGTITATRYDEYIMRMTITVVQRGSERVSVRVNARSGEDAVSDAATYQDFFVALDKAMFLTLQRVD